MQNSVHSLHYFPGNFIPQIPAHLIQLLSEEGDIVYDPFCGSGTTGVETIRLGRRSLQSDLNRLGILVAEGKLIAFTNRNVGRDLIKFLDQIMLSDLIASETTEMKKNHEDDDSAKWFHHDTFKQLRFLWDKIESFTHKETRTTLEMIFSDTLFACASTAGALTSTGGKRRHHWGWIADNVIPKQPVYHSAINLFRDRLMHTIDIINFSKDNSKSVFKVFRSDVCNIGLLSESIDCVVTSPPYIGMIDYTLANRLHYLWRGWPIQEDKEQEIGARFKRNKKNLVTEYLSSIYIAVKELERILKPGGYCAIIIGASRKFPYVANDVINVFANELKTIWGPKLRHVTKRRISEKKGTEITELLCVYQKQ